MTKDPDVPVVDSLEGYDGVEFKTRGRQVVAAGSRHPDGGKSPGSPPDGIYVWEAAEDPLGDVELVPLSAAPPAPKRLMSLIRRPVRQELTGGEGGELSQLQVAELLDELDPVQFGQDGPGHMHGIDWLTLMMACHHASNGEARSEFLEWCSRDPRYAQDSWIVGRRWDSLHSEARSGGTPVTYRTLAKLLTAEGKANRLPPPSNAGDDFDDDLPPEVLEKKRQVKEREKSAEVEAGDQDDVPDHEKVGPLERLNRRLFAVNNGGSFRIMFQQHDPALDRKEWVSMSKQAFEDFYSNRRVEKVTPKGEVVAVPLANEWLTWGKRRTANGVVFDPEGKVGMHKGWLNMWTGWGVDQAPGDWPYTQELIHDVLCDGDDAAGEFVLNWLAYMVQHPGTPPEVAICFRGDKGTGKSTLGQALCTMAGRHGLHVTSPKHVTGDFNAHLMDCIFLFADEAVGPRDQKAQAALKSLITDRHKAYEAKGVDLRTGINRVHVMMASNDDWFVDAGMTDGERRYFVSEVSNRHQGNRTGFFTKVHQELYGNGNAGIKAMLHDLQTRDLGSWAPRGNVPASSALVDQKLRNLDMFGQWWYSLLDAGSLGFDAVDEDADWTLEPVRVIRHDLRESYAEAAKKKSRSGDQGNNMWSDRFFWRELKKYCPSMDVDAQVKVKVPSDRYDVPGVARDGRTAGVVVPSLGQCRADLERLAGGPIPWGRAG
jgi:hypothetical protein